MAQRLAFLERLALQQQERLDAISTIPSETESGEKNTNGVEEWSLERKRAAEIEAEGMKTSGRDQGLR
jgi:hypothetical protein